MLSPPAEPSIAPDALPRASAPRRAVTRGLSWSWNTAARYQTLLRTVGVSLAIFLLWAVQGALLARLLGPKVRGEFGTAVLYAQMLLFIGLLGSHQTIARRAAAGRESLATLRRTALRFGFGTGISTAVLVMALAWIALPAEKHYLAPMCMVGALVLPWDHMRLALLAVDHGSGSFARYNFCRLVAAALVPLFLVILWMNGQHALLPAVLCVVLASLIGLIVQVFTGPRISLRGASNPPLRALAKEGIPYTLGILANNFYGRLDALLILWLADLTAQGNYAAAVPTAGLMLVVPATLELFAFNVGARPDYSPSRRRIIAAGGALVLFQVVSALAFALLLEPMMLLVFGEAFRAAIPFARALLPALALNGCAMLAEGFLRGRGKPHQVTIGNVLGIVALAIAAYALYGRYQALAVPLAAGVSRAVCFIYLAAAAVADVWTHGPPSSGLSTAEGRA